VKPLFAREHDEVLKQLAFSRVLLAFDFDGTLAPIVADRERAALRAPTERLFRRVCELYPCAVISGRERRDLLQRLGGAPVEYVLGNRGLELDRTRKQAAEFERQIAAALPHLERALAGVSGLEIENKLLSIAVHYRRSRGKRAARSAIARAVARLPTRMRLVTGKFVVNVVPADAPNKGDALLTLRERATADTALYVGDDISDEDVFSLDQPGRLLGVRVGRSLRSAAPFYLRDQREIDTLLRTLAALRGGLAPERAGALGAVAQRCATSVGKR